MKPVYLGLTDATTVRPEYFGAPSSSFTTLTRVRTALYIELDGTLFRYLFEIKGRQ